MKTGKSVWTGRILSAFISLFMLLDAGSHIAKPVPVVEAFNRLNFPLDRAAALGIIALICVIVYAIPQTSILGAILLTGYLGGAVATHLRARDPLFDTIFPIIFGVLAWLGVYLRNACLRTLVPIAKGQ